MLEKERLLDEQGRHRGQLPGEMSNTEKFDLEIMGVTKERGEVYGHPIDMFNRAARGQEIIRKCDDIEVRHALEMIWVKICRLIETPDHFDSAKDIAGYAKCICMIVDKRKQDGNM